MNEALIEAIFQFGPAWALLFIGLILGYKLANRLIDIWAAHLTNRLIQVAKIIEIAAHVTDTAERFAEIAEQQSRKPQPTH
jgi:hypothetical protein